MMTLFIRLILLVCFTSTIGGYGFLGYSNQFHRRSRPRQDNEGYKRTGVISRLAVRNVPPHTIFSSNRRKPLFRTFVNTKRQLLPPPILSIPFQRVRPKFLIPRILRRHDRNNQHHKNDDSGITWKTLAIKSAPPIDILANKKSFVLHKPIIGPMLKIPPGRFKSGHTFKKSRVFIPKLITNEIPKSLMNKMNSLESHEIHRLNNNVRNVTSQHTDIKQQQEIRKAHRIHEAIKETTSLELSHRKNLVPDRRFSIPARGTTKSLSKESFRKFRKDSLMPHIMHPIVKMLNRGNSWKKSSVKRAQTDMYVHKKTLGGHDNGMNLDDLNSKGHYMQVTLPLDKHEYITKTDNNSVKKFVESSTADESVDKKSFTDLPHGTSAKLVDKFSSIERNVRKKNRQSRTPSEDTDVKSKVHNNVVSDDIEENEMGRQITNKEKKLDSHETRNNMEHNNVYVHEVKFDPEDVKNNSDHEVKLVDLNPAGKKIKPKETKDDDDEECSTDAQKKGICNNDIQKTQVTNNNPAVDNSKNIHSIGSSKHTHSEMPSLKKKPSCQCRSETGVCSCEAITTTDGTTIEKTPSPPLDASTTECNHQLPGSCPANNNIVAASHPLGATSNASICQQGDASCVAATAEASSSNVAVTNGQTDVTPVSSLATSLGGGQPCTTNADGQTIANAACTSNGPTGSEGGSTTSSEGSQQSGPSTGSSENSGTAESSASSSGSSLGGSTSSSSGVNNGGSPTSSCDSSSGECNSGASSSSSAGSSGGPSISSSGGLPSSSSGGSSSSSTGGSSSSSSGGSSSSSSADSTGGYSSKEASESSPSSGSSYGSSSGSALSESSSESTGSTLSSADTSRLGIDGFIEDLPNVKGILSSSFTKKKYNFRSCEFVATANKNGVECKLHPTAGCTQISFSALIQQLLGGEYDLAGPSDNLIVIGKFDALGFNIDKVRERISFSLACKELMDIIPNKLRISNGKVMLNFSYETFPKSISDFVIKIDGVIHLNYRSRILNINVDKGIDSTLFMIEMTARDLELPEFTKLFTQTEILQNDLPSDLQTLVTSSLRSPRISGLYDSGGAFEFVASAKSPASIFPMQPMVYVIIQKPRLGKVVSGLIVNFERAMYKSLLSTILDKDLSGLPLFKDVRTDLALGVSSDGLYVIKDAMFNKEVGSLFDSGKPIKKGLTYKAKLPIGKIVSDSTNTSGNTMTRVGSSSSSSSSSTSSSSTTEGIPDNVLIDCEITANKMHLQFPEGLSLSLMNIGGFFGQEGQDMNFPTVSGEIGRNILTIRNYEVENIEKKSVAISFASDAAMKIGSLMTLGNIEAQLKRDEYTKWSFVCTGDYQLGDTSVSVSLTSETDGFVISSKPSSIRSQLLVDVLDKTEEILKSELQMYHMDDFVIEDFRISGSLKSTNIIRFAGKPALFGVETSVIEFVATQEETGSDLLAMGLLFENVDLDKVFGRMLDRNLLRRSWAVGTNIGLFVSSSRTAGDLRFEMGGLAKTRIQPGNHLRVLLLRPEPAACKGDSLCKVLSAEMPVGSAFLLDGYMVEGTLKLSETIKDPLVLSKSLILRNVALKMRIKDSVEIYVTGSLTLPGVDGVGFTGELRVDNTGHLQLKMAGNDTWKNPFGLKNTAFFNSTLSATFEPGFPVPTMDVKADISIGVDPLDTSKTLSGPVSVKVNSGSNGRNTFTAKIKDINFEKLAQATGSKRQLLRFQKDALFLDDALLSYGPIKNELTKDVTTRDNTHEEAGHEKTEDDDVDSSNEKSEIKLTGRMKILGTISDYTMKFLQDGTQLLAEVQMPDIGVNRGELTIKAGLKRHSVHSDPQSPKGPTLLIRMDPTMNSGIIVGRISALGFSRLSAIKVEDEGFSSMMFGQLPGNHSTNVTLHSMFEPNLEDANFQISACLPVQKPVRDALMNYLQDKASLTKKTLIAGEERVQKTEDIFKKTSSNIKNYESMANMFLSEMRMKGDQLLKLKEELKRRCVPDCGESCMGLPTWKAGGIKLGNAPMGAPSWAPCSRRIPDLSCIVRCLGEKVIGNVRANRKQVELQGLISSLAETKNIIRTNRMYDARARNLVNSTAGGLNKIKNTIQVGQDIANFMNSKDNNIQVNNVCFQDSLDNAERALVNFEASTMVNGAEKKMVIPSTLDGNTEYNIAEGIANTIFPGFFDFNKNLEQVKVLFSNLDGEKDEIEKLMGKTNELMEKSNVEVRSEVDWNPEEIEFRKLAFGELPRFTLSDDETMRAFEDQSLWNIAPQNDPLFSKLKEENVAANKSLASLFAEGYLKGDKKFTGGTPCDQLKRSINHYGEVINALSDFTKKFLQERSVFHRQKNHRLADLRMIDDQIKSDCFIENCTVEDMDNALSYLGKAKYGTLRWASVIENQIEEQNKVALSYFSRRAGDIVEANQGLSLRSYIVNVKSMASRAIKKTTVPGKTAVEDEIKEIGKEMYHMLIGVKNSDELSTSSPKIFRLKRQVQTLQHSKNMCTNITSDTPDDDGTEFLSDKHRTVKANFMNSKFLDHKNDDDDFVSPIIKENELDDDDEDSKAEENSETNNDVNNDENSFSIDETEPSLMTKSDTSVIGEQRATFPNSSNQNHDIDEPHDKDPVGSATVNIKPSLKSETVPTHTSKDSEATSKPKEDRLTSELSMINDDVLSFDNDLRLDLPDKADKHMP